MLSISECIVGRYALYPAHTMYDVGEGAKWGGMLSIREGIVGRYAFYRRLSTLRTNT